MAKELRLDKYLSEMGLGTRSQIKEAAKKGRVLMNGQIEKKTDRKVSPDRDKVFFDGREIHYVTTEYYMLNKPQGVISATEDKRHVTVLDLIEDAGRKDLFPVGRLDIDTEGLLLITNDGDLAHRLLSPKHHVDKVYYAKVEGNLQKDVVEKFELGIVLSDGTQTLPAKLEILCQAEGESEVQLTIQEGKFHQVKRMIEAVDGQVVYLKRLSMGNLKLDEALEPGDYRPLTEEEIKKLKEL